MKKVLFIGNSFTFYFDVPLQFEFLALKTGREVMTEYAVKGGETFTHAADFGTEFGGMVKEKLYHGVQYDRIILQEQSYRPIVYPELFHTGLQDLLAQIKKAQPQAEVVLYATWGYADDYQKWDQIPGERKLNHDLMTELLHEAYQKEGEFFSLPVVYVGDIFHRVYREYDRDPYFTDRKHPSYTGSMCAALAHFLAAFPDVKREELPVQHHPSVQGYEWMLDVTFEVVRGEKAEKGCEKKL